MSRWSVVHVDGAVSDGIGGHGDAHGRSRGKQEACTLQSPQRSNVQWRDERASLQQSQRRVEQPSHTARSRFVVPQTQAFAAPLPPRRANLDDETVRRCCRLHRRRRPPFSLQVLVLEDSPPPSPPSAQQPPGPRAAAMGANSAELSECDVDENYEEAEMLFSQVQAAVGGARCMAWRFPHYALLVLPFRSQRRWLQQRQRRAA